MDENRINKVEKYSKSGKEESISAYDIVEIIAVAFAVVIFVFNFVGRMTTVDGSSMSPTLENGERLWVMSMGYTPGNGDVVVVHEDDGELNYPLVKRIIAMGGQTIEFDFEEWSVYVDGELLEEDYVNYDYFVDMKSYGCPEKVVVPDGYVFVMGDNRNGSTDSRDDRVGFVSEDDIVGKVVCRIWPMEKFGFVK